jgi:transcriptional regulator with XRE-family HTH domain
MELGSRIAAWRKARGWSQRQLAEAVGVTVSAVSYWESGTTKPSRHLEKVVAAFGVEMAEFYGKVPKAKKAAA